MPTLASAPRSGRLSAEQKRELLGTFVTAVRLLGVATLLALAGLLPTGERALQVLLASWLVLVVFSAAYLARTISLLRAVVFAAANLPDGAEAKEERSSKE